MAPGTVPNAYPELPELPFVRTVIAVTDVIGYISSTAVITPVKCAAYVIFRNESGGGLHGINNNYAGFQADGDRRAPKWTPFFSGTCVTPESGTGNLRRFLCFKDWRGCIGLLSETVNLRGLYVGGYAHPYANMQINTVDDWPLGYWREWVNGDSTSQVSPADKSNLLAEYADAVSKFP